MSHHRYLDYSDLPLLKKGKCWWTLSDSDKVFDQSADQLSLLKEVIDYGSRDEVVKFTEKYLWRHHLSEVPHLSEVLRHNVASLNDSQLSGRMVLLFAPLLSDYGINHPWLQERILYREEGFEAMLLAAIECLPLAKGTGDTIVWRFYGLNGASIEDLELLFETCAIRGITFSTLSRPLSCMKALLEMREKATVDIIEGAYGFTDSDEFIAFILDHGLAEVAFSVIEMSDWLRFIEEFPERADEIPFPDEIPDDENLIRYIADDWDILFMDNAVKHLIDLYGYEDVLDHVRNNEQTRYVTDEFEKQFRPIFEPKPANPTAKTEVSCCRVS